MNAESKYGRFGSGQSVRRIEDPALVTGTGRFVDDVSLPGQLTLCFLRSPVPHARIGRNRVKHATTPFTRSRDHHARVGSETGRRVQRPRR